MPKLATQIIDEQIAEVEARIKKAEAEISRQQAAIDKAQIEMGTLVRFRKVFALEGGVKTEKLRPSKAILAYLGQHGPSTGPDIINFLEGRVKTSAANVRDNLLQTLYYLVEKNKVLKNGDRYDLTT